MSHLVGTWMPGMFVSKVCYVIKLFPSSGPPDWFLLEIPAGYSLHQVSRLSLWQGGPSLLSRVVLWIHASWVNLQTH